MWYVDIVDFLIIAAMFFFHELAHYFDARRFNTYDGIFFTGISMGVNLKDPFPSRWYYLGGFIFSMLVYPVAILLSSYGLANNAWWYVFPIIALGISIGDIIVFVFWKPKIPKFFVMKDSLFNRWWLMLYGINRKRAQEVGIIWIKGK